MSAVIGIDLGTSTTEAAVFRNGAPEMILNLEGEAIIPSAVGIDREGNWIAGARAKAQYLLEPENTAIEVKRKTGTDEQIRIGKVTYEPMELQAKLLTYVRTYVSEFLGESVERAVISVPAYFDNLQRTETILAGRLAGFTVERILNEPTAAAMSYGLEHMDEESHVLVYDLGGGTFDVTLLEMFEGVLEVKASSGDNQLGGKDFDERLMETLLNRFQKKHRVNLRTDRRAMVRLKEEAEKCKIALSEREAYRVLLPAVSVVSGNPVEMDETISRREFEELTRDLLERTHGPINTVLGDAGLSETEIDRVILVGGSTRMPMVARDISKFLGINPTESVHPDYAVAMGAAIQAGIISGEIDSEQGLVMTDVNSFSLGVRTADDGFGETMSVIIPRSTTIPVTRKQTYVTSSPGQTRAGIEVYQGESRVATHNHYLGEFTVDGIPPAPAGQEKLDVEFCYDLNGILNVRAMLLSTGKEMSIRIDMKAGRQEEDLSAWKDAEAAKEYRAVVRTAERVLSKQESLSPGIRERMRNLLDDLKRAILKGNLDTADEAETELNAMIRKLKENK